MAKRFSKPSKRIVFTVFLLILGLLSPHFLSSQQKITQAQEQKTEINSKRTSNSKTYDNGDGTITTRIYQDFVHYQDENGDWLDITQDVTPSEREGYDWQVADNRFKYYFKADHSQDWPVLASYKGHDLYQKIAAVCHYDPDTKKITILQKVRDVMAEIVNGRVRYPGVFTGVDLEYKIDTNSSHGNLYISEQGKVALLNAIQQQGLNPDGWIFFATKLDLDSYNLNPDVIMGHNYERRIRWKDAANKILHWFVPDVAKDERPGPEGERPCQLRIQNHPSLGWLLFTALPLGWLRDSVGAITIDPPTDYYGETADGYISGYNATYSTARSTSTSCDTADTRVMCGQYWSENFYDVFHGYLSFDTSAIPDDASVTAATLYACAQADDSLVDFLIQVYRYAWAEALCDNREANYDGAYGGSATLEGTLRNTANGWVPGTYYSLAVATAGINKAGDTKYTLVSKEDVDNSAPAADWAKREYVSARSADYAGTTSDPYLAVTYTVNQTPTNDSLTFTNPYTGGSNNAVADNSTEWNFRAVVSDTDGYTNLGTVVLRLANSSDNTTPYDALKFTWTESTDAFSETADTQNAATITSTGTDSTCATNTCTLDFKIKFNSSFSTQSTNYNAELYTTDDAAATDEDSYASFYQVVPISISISSPSDVSLGTITGTGTSSTGEATWTVTTNNPSGYKLEWQASTATMINSYSDTIAAYAPAVADTPETWSVATTDSEWGGRLKSTSTDYASGTWGTDDSSNAKWLNVKSSALFQIASRASTTTGSNEIVQFKAQVGSSKFQPTGTYTVNVMVTATTL